MLAECPWFVVATIKFSAFSLAGSQTYHLGVVFIGVTLGKTASKDRKRTLGASHAELLVARSCWSDTF